MSSDDDDDPPKNFDVGFGRPPKSTRYKKGVSGNPAGRPKGSKNCPPRFGDERLQKRLKKVAYRTVEIKEGGETITITIVEAMLRSAFAKAIKGDLRATALLMEHLQAVEAQEAALRDEYLKAAIEYKISMSAKKDAYVKAGLTPPTFFPDPDVIKIDVPTGDATIEGPMFVEDEPAWREAREAQRLFEKSKELCTKLLTVTDGEERERLMAEIVEVATALKKAGLLGP